MNGLVSKLIFALCYIFTIYLDLWEDRREKRESAETEWAGSKIKIIHRNAREIKTSKEEEEKQ